MMEHLHEHSEEHGHGHTHVHDPEKKKKQLNRVSRIIGHLEHVKKMIEADEDCSDVLIQLKAVRSAVGSLSKEIIEEHTLHCIAHAIEDGDQEKIQDFIRAMQKYSDL
jgi:DNA-binding FrmR family transcriptional regulator